MPADEKQTALKRSRGKASCAECRRLKLKCNRTAPCNSCVRRGCQVICPNGVLSSGKGSRFILAETKELHRKMTDMSNRIRQLEDALTIAHATSSQSPHPLMTPALLEIKHGVYAVDDLQDDSHATGTDELDKDIMLSFGDLTLAESGVSEALLTIHVDPDNSEQRNSDPPAQSGIPPEIKQLSRTFPMAPMYLPEDEIQELIELQLPSYERASSLCESYLQHIGWLWRLIGREQIVEELLPAAYKQRRGRSSTQSLNLPAQKNRMDPHELAALLMVFTSGAVADYTLAPCNDEAELYFHLGRAALGLKPVLEGASLAAVQAVTLMGLYDFFSCRKKSLESTWKVLNLGMMLGISIGLHRDPTHWKLEAKMIQRRREVFWELRYMDAWRCFGSGRPATIHSDDTDCELPIDSDATLDEEGKEVPSFWRWKYTALRDVLLIVAHRLGSAKPLKYADILVLDRKVRDFAPRYLAMPIHDQAGIEGYNEGDDEGAYCQKLMQRLMKFIIIQLLHRNFFARALLEDPVNPMKSTFAPSVLAAYYAALSVLHILRAHITVMPHVMLRFWSFWSHALNASMILGSIAARMPTSEMAPQAYINLNLSIITLMKAQSHPAIQAGLPGLLRLREKARVALIGVGIDPDQIMKDSKAMSEQAAEMEKSGNYQRREETYEMQNQYLGTASCSSTSAAEVNAAWHTDTPEDDGANLSAPGAPVSVPKHSLFGEINSEPSELFTSHGALGREAAGIASTRQVGSDLNGSRNQVSMSDESSVLSALFPRSAPIFQAHSQEQAQSQEFDLFSDINLALDIPPGQYNPNPQASTIFPSFSTTPGAFNATTPSMGVDPSSLQRDVSAIGLHDESSQSGAGNGYDISQMPFGLQESEFAALMALDVGPISSSSFPEGFNMDWVAGFDEFGGASLLNGTEGVFSLFDTTSPKSLSTTDNNVGESAGNVELERLLKGGN